jgi:ribosomal protein S18 acetylase RimI-like enzyme
MEMLIRHLREDDRPQWQTLYYAYLTFYESTPVAEATNILWGRLMPMSPEIQSAEIQIPDIQSAVIEANGTVVGFVHYHFQLSSWTASSQCYLEDLYVEPQFRGQGMATTLIAEVKRAAFEKGCSELFWITRSGNSTARSLYDKLATESDFVRYEIVLHDESQQ